MLSTLPLGFTLLMYGFSNNTVNHKNISRLHSWSLQYLLLHLFTKLISWSLCKLHTHLCRDTYLWQHDFQKIQPPLASLGLPFENHVSLSGYHDLHCSKSGEWFMYPYTTIQQCYSNPYATIQIFKKKYILAKK